MKFLAISDIHFDPFEDLDAARLRQLTATDVSEWPVLLRAAGQRRRMDSTYSLFQSALDHASQVVPSPAFIVYPGDYMCHRWQHRYADTSKSWSFGRGDAYDDYRTFTRKTIEFVGERFQQAFPGVPMYGTFGNDDSLTADYGLERDGHFLHDVAATWSQQRILGDVIDDSRLADIGCYSARLPLPNHRIVSITSLFWSKSFCTRAAQYDLAQCGGCNCAKDGRSSGDEVLAYLGTALHDAHQAGDKVWLVMHIPPGLDAYTEADHGGRAAWAHQWADGRLDAYLGVIEQHVDVDDHTASTMQFAFAGHTHMDDYRLARRSTAKGGAPLLVHKIVPSVSPIFGNDPAFQVYDVDDASGAITDWTTYHCDGSWQWNTTAEYVASRAYSRVPSMPQAALTLFEGMLVDTGSLNTDGAHYNDFYKSGGGHIVHRSSPHDLNYYTCAVTNLHFSDYEACLSAHGLATPEAVDSPVVIEMLKAAAAT